jgi:hypothetical protein
MGALGQKCQQGRWRVTQVAQGAEMDGRIEPRDLGAMPRKDGQIGRVRSDAMGAQKNHNRDGVRLVSPKLNGEGYRNCARVRSKGRRQRRNVMSGLTKRDL